MKKIICFLFIVSSVLAYEGPGFEVVNKSPDDVWIALANAKVSGKAKEIALLGKKVPSIIKAGKRIEVPANINWQGDTVLYVWPKDPGKVTIETGYKKDMLLYRDNHDYRQETPALKPYAPFMFGFDRKYLAKTIYLTLEKDPQGNIRIRPQTGKWKGFLGKTQSGYDLGDNIKKENIFNIE